MPSIKGGMSIKLHEIVAYRAYIGPPLSPDGNAIYTGSNGAPRTILWLMKVKSWDTLWSLPFNGVLGMESLIVHVQSCSVFCYLT